MTSTNITLPERPAVLGARTETATPLHARTDPPLESVQLARWIEPQIAEQIEQAAWWQEQTLREGWRLGDYSVYSMAFAAPGFEALQIRFISISGPDRSAMLEVSASNDEPHFRAVAPNALRAAFPATGFRPAGARAEYCMPVHEGGGR